MNQSLFYYKHLSNTDLFDDDDDNNRAIQGCK